MPIQKETFALLLPEIALVVTAVIALVGSAFVKNRNAWMGISVLGLIVAGVLLWRQDSALLLDGALTVESLGVTSGPLFIDPLGHAVRWLALLVGSFFVLALSRGATDDLVGELMGCVLLTTVGMMIVGSSSDLVLLFLGLELISVPTYVILFLARNADNSFEATIKYFLLSILASAMLLYGFSFVYGVSGSTSLLELSSRLAATQHSGSEGSNAWLSYIAFIAILAGLGFKIAAVPFHFYAPDVYQGSTSAGAGLLAVVPKIAGIIAIIRVLVIGLTPVVTVGWQVLLVVSILTMTLGNICALWQNNVRRLLAYSSIAHAGYMLIGLSVAVGAAGTETGRSAISATYLYLLVYSIASLGTFAALEYLSGTKAQISRLSELAGLGQTAPLVALAIAVFMFSLSGIPPLAGFWGKLGLFTSAVSLGLFASENVGPVASWYIVLAVGGAINAAIAAAYYLRVVGIMYFQKGEQALHCQGGLGALTSCVCCTFLALAIGIFPMRATRLSQWASLSYPMTTERAADVDLATTEQARVE